MKITKEFLEKEYWTLNKSCNLIAKELKVPRHTITNAMVKFKVKYRTLTIAKIPKGSLNIPNNKWCSFCKQDKPFSQFSKDKRNKGHGLAPICRHCATVHARKYYAKNNKSRQLVKANLIIEFGNKCSHCKITNLPIASYSFHHHSQSMTHKDYIRVNKVLTSKNKELIKKEKLKWILLCANCHNLFHSDCRLTANEIIKL